MSLLRADVLCDTNIILRFVDAQSSEHGQVMQAVKQLDADGLRLCVSPQNLIEFWNVATRPLARNGFVLTPMQADARVGLVEHHFFVLPDTPSIYTLWRQVALLHEVSGVQVHDARLVAVMQAHGVGHLLTFNVRDFGRYVARTGITLLDSATVGKQL